MRTIELVGSRWTFLRAFLSRCPMALAAPVVAAPTPAPPPLQR
jgi:hypothetical protein